MKFTKKLQRNLKENLNLNLNLSVNPLLLKDLLFRKEDRAQLFLEQPEDKRLEILESLTPAVRRDVLRHIPDEEVVAILEPIDPDQATDLLQLLGPKKRERVLQLMSQDLKDSLSTLLEFDAATAAGLMTLDYVQADFSDTVAIVAKKFKEHEKRTGRPPVILMMKDDKLVGFLPGHELGFAAKSERVGKFAKRIPSIS